VNEIYIFVHAVATHGWGAVGAQNWQSTQCPFHQLGNTLADFVKWPVLQIERNTYTTAESSAANW